MIGTNDEIKLQESILAVRHDDDKKSINIYIHKFADVSWEQSEGSLFNSYDTEV